MIAHIPDARDLNRFPLRLFKPLFATLAPPEPAGLAGKYEAAFTGPGWLRRSAAPALALGGLRGWWGKDFTPGGGTNLVLREDTFAARLPLQRQPGSLRHRRQAGGHRALRCGMPLPLDAHLRRAAPDRGGAAAGHDTRSNSRAAPAGVPLPAGTAAEWQWIMTPW